MTQGTIWKHLVTFSLPMAAGLLFQQLYNTVDTIVVGQFVGKEALAAVGSTGSILNMIVGTCAGLATGAGVIIAQNYGAHDNQKLSSAVHTAIALSFVLSVLATAAGVLLVDPMLRLMKTDETVMDEAHEYLTIYFSGVSGVLIYNMASGILRAVGDSRRPLYFLILSAVLNTVFDLVFVRVFGMKVDGVAWATVLAQAISAALSLTVLTIEDKPYGLHWGRLRFERKALGDILRVGLPSAVQSGLTAFSNVFVQSYINQFGPDCTAGWAAYNKLDAVTLVPVQAISMASATFVGQNWGARDRLRARSGVNQAMIMAISSTVLLGLVAVLLPKPLLHLFTPDEEVIAYGVRFVRMITPFYFTICFNQIYSGALRGTGDATTPTIIMFSSFVLFRQLYLFVTSKIFTGDAAFVAVALAYPMGWLMCSVLQTVMYRRSRLFRAGGEQA